MADQPFDKLCKALDIVEKNVQFYEKAIDACETGPGKEVFTHIRNEEKEQLEKIKEIHSAMSEGQNFANACTLDEEAGEQVASSLLRTMVSKYGESKACTSEMQAIGTGLDMKKSTIEFFENWLENSTDSKEKEFVERMVQEQRAQFILLNDLQYYYEDPQAWALKEDHQVLDGA